MLEKDWITILILSIEEVITKHILSFEEGIKEYAAKNVWENIIRNKYLSITSFLKLAICGGFLFILHYT